MSFSRTICPTRGLLSAQQRVSHHYPLPLTKTLICLLFIGHFGQINFTFFGFIYFISFTDKVYSKQARWHCLISSILTQCSFRSNRGSWQPWCTLLALPYRRLRVRRRRCRRPSSCSRSSDTTGGLHCHRHMRQPGNIAKNDTGKEAKFFSWLCKDLLHKSLQEIPCHPQHTFGSL